MDWTVILEFVRPELLILIAVTWCLGLFIKQTPKIQDWLIPIILLLFSVIFTVLWIAVVLGNGFTAAVIISAVGQGIIIAAIAVFGNEVIKQISVKRKE